MLTYIAGMSCRYVLSSVSVLRSGKLHTKLNWLTSRFVCLSFC